MCIAIVKPLNKRIPVDFLKEGFCSNPHGAGYAVAANGQIAIKKGFFSIEEFLDSFLEENQDAPMLVHCRWSTHSAQNAKNCHPWQLNNNTALIHNGVLAGFTGFHNGLSDTGNFVENIIKPAVSYNPEVWKTPWFTQLLTDAVANNGNKLAIMDHTGDYAIYGEHLGYWVDGVWFSNRDFEAGKKRK